MYIPYWLLIALALTVTLLLTAAYCLKPKHVAIHFTNVPPVIARVNTPSAQASDLQRTIHLPTGDKYIIPSGLRGHFVMVFDWSFAVTLEGKRTEITIPSLSATDFASIPRFLHSLISPLNNTIYSAIVHDYLYRNPQDGFSRDLPREMVDRIFYWGMRVRGVSRITAGIMYLGVRLGGASSYRRERQPIV